MKQFLVAAIFLTAATAGYGQCGKVTLYATMDGQPDQMIRLVADKFEEKM